MLFVGGPARRAGLLLLLGFLPFFPGCASPGAPRPPSLQLPQPVRTLTAVRTGNAVQLSFTVSARSTDGVFLREGPLRAVLCRQDTPSAPCHELVSPAGQSEVQIPAPGSSSPVELTDSLPSALTQGPPGLLTYRVELQNSRGRSAGESSPAYAAAGAAPLPIEALQPTGIRAGVHLNWAAAPDAGEVLLMREQLLPASGASASAGSSRRNATALTLQADPGNRSASQSTDGTVEDGAAYRYTAQRRQTVHLGGHTLELRSRPSAPVEITWHDVYPPAAPQQLRGAGFLSGSAGFAVDLIWQPVQDLRLRGYLVSRTPLAADGTTAGSAELLTSEPLPVPGFHDATALPDRSYRYEVRAVDGKGNRSQPAALVLGGAGH